jgi:hypothetical protein
MQPTYFPWLGYFDLIDDSDIFVFLDDVQIVKKTKNTWDCRNRINSNNGEIMLIAPVSSRQENGIKNFNSSYYLSNDWKKKHLKTIELNYKKSIYFEEIYKFISDLLEYDNLLVSEFNIHIIKSIAYKIGVQSQYYKSSELNIEGVKDERLVNISNHLKVNKYLSPKGASTYIEEKNESGFFVNSNINLIYQNYLPYTYNSIHKNYISHLSILDLLFSVGFQNSLEIIKNGRGSYLFSKDFMK